MPQTAARRPGPPRWVPWAVITIALLPAAWGVLAILSDVYRNTRYLGAHPVKELEHFYGDWILRFLIATLLITPVRRFTGWNWLQKYRRRLGLVAFTYACLHLVTYVFLDNQLDWPTLIEDIAKRWYITIGMTAFVLLLALAVTSTAGSVRRLGKRWVTLHRAIYVIVVLGTMHYWMSVKEDITEPARYAFIFAALLGYRAWHYLRSRSQRPASSRSPQPNSATSE
jgi:sulfoxide reductase heme-binding subunit YedZ